MTKEELSSLFYLSREIEMLVEKKRELEEAAVGSAYVLSGMPGTSPGVSRVLSYQSRIHDLKRLIERRIEQCFFERERLERYIEEVPDSEMRMILTYRYINGLTFQQIAFSIGYQDESVPRKRHDRFLKRAMRGEAS